MPEHARKLVCCSLSDNSYGLVRCMMAKSNTGSRRLWSMLHTTFGMTLVWVDYRLSWCLCTKGVGTMGQEDRTYC